jgi:hypothetical protein
VGQVQTCFLVGERNGTGPQNGKNQNHEKTNLTVPIKLVHQHVQDAFSGMRRQLALVYLYTHV